MDYNPANPAITGNKPEKTDFQVIQKKQSGVIRSGMRNKIKLIFLMVMVPELFLR